jgi:hypothetical protein
MKGRRMKKFISLVASICMALPNIVLAAPPELGKYPQVFKSGSYIVTVLRVGKDESTLLIKVDGLDNAFDGQIYKHTQICENTACTNYKYETTEIPGKKRWWTIQSSRPWGDYDSMILYPPGIDKKQELYKDNRPESFDPLKFYMEYEGQLAIRK